MASTQVASYNVTPVKKVHFSETEDVKAEPAAHTFVSPRKIRNGHNRKRSSSFSVADRQHHFKRRRKEEFVRPTKFLLGGNSRDPLNLGSLADESVNRALNEKTPESSPLPTPKHHKEEIEVLVPCNIRDPLNLNVPVSSLTEQALISPEALQRNRRRNKARNRRRRRTNSAGDVLDVIQRPEVSDEVFVKPLAPLTASTPIADKPPSVTDRVEPTSSGPKLKLELPSRLARRPEDKIVSPVVPQPGARKQRTHHHQGSSHAKHFPFVRKKDDTKFKYGNYRSYYRDMLGQDQRLLFLNRDWFQGKDVLDIGCNEGYLTLAIAKDFSPRHIVGIDIDPLLVSFARKNVRRFKPEESWNFPRSMALMYGPIPYASFGDIFPNNVTFVVDNYVLDDDALLERIGPEYDVITCFSVTKWIHLNWGDAGLKRVFKKVFAQLRPGGRFVLEAQSWTSYSKRKKLTEEIAKNYAAIQLYPERFADYLLSDVGFCTCEVIATPSHSNERHRRPIQVFVKSDSVSPK